MLTHDLPLLIAAAAPGATLRLSGRYELAEPLIVDRPLTLAAADGAEVEVIGEFAGELVTLVGSDAWTLEGIAFVHNPGDHRAIVRTDGGLLTARRCTFIAAEAHAAGSGLAAHGAAALALDDCEFSAVCDGLEVMAQACAEVRNCRFMDNSHYGVEVGFDARLIASSSLFAENEMCGIGLFGDATAEFSDIDVRDNGYHGVQLMGAARAELVGSHCHHNEGAGALVGGQGHARIRDTLFDHNNINGVAYQGDATGELASSTAEFNMVDGIALLDRARVTLRGATARDNGTRAGVASGISVEDSADGRLYDAICSANSDVGIAFKGASTGLVQGGRLAGNTAGAIRLSAASHVEVVDQPGEVIREAATPDAG